MEETVKKFVKVFGNEILWNWEGTGSKKEGRNWKATWDECQVIGKELMSNWEKTLKEWFKEWQIKGNESN